jgi:hypothetical protein
MSLRTLPRPARDGIWIALVTGASILFSLTLACATPFAAIATIAGAKIARRDAAILIGIAWLGNQAVGYLILGYPQTWDSFAWGGTIGVAALLAVLATSTTEQQLGPSAVSLVICFLAAFAVYELTLFAATAILPSTGSAFSVAVVARIFAINATALVGLILLHRTAVDLGVLAPAHPLTPSGARA